MNFINQCLKTFLGEFNDPNRSLIANLCCFATYAIFIWAIVMMLSSLWKRIVVWIQTWFFRRNSDAYFVIVSHLYKNFHKQKLAIVDRLLVFVLAYMLRVHFRAVAVKHGHNHNQFDHVFDICRRIVSGVRTDGADSIRAYIAVCVQISNAECGIDWKGFDTRRGGLFASGFANVYSAFLEMSERDDEIIKLYAQEVVEMLSGKKGLSSFGDAIRKFLQTDYTAFSFGAQRLPEYIQRHIEYAKRLGSIEVMAVWISALQSAERYLALVQLHGQRTVGLEEELKDLCQKMNEAGAYTYALRVQTGKVQIKMV